jgi:hypothetical protein
MRGSNVVPSGAVHCLIEIGEKPLVSYAIFLLLPDALAIYMYFLCSSHCILE